MQLPNSSAIMFITPSTLKLSKITSTQVFLKVSYLKNNNKPSMWSEWYCSLFGGKSTKEKTTTIVQDVGAEERPVRELELRVHAEPGLESHILFFFGAFFFQHYDRSPRMRRASWMSFGMIVTRLAWMAHKFVSSKRLTIYASVASCSAMIALP